MRKAKSNKKGVSVFKGSYIPATLSNEITAKKETVSTEIPYFKAAIFIVIINILTIIAILFLQRYLPPEIPLFYGLPDTVEQLATTRSLIIPPAISTTIIIINTTVCVFIKDEFLKKTLMISGLATFIFSIIAIIRIVFLVGSF